MLFASGGSSNVILTGRLSLPELVLNIVFSHLTGLPISAGAWVMVASEVLTERFSADPGIISMVDPLSDSVVPLAAPTTMTGISSPGTVVVPSLA